MIEMSLEFKYAQGNWTLVTVNSRMIPDKQWFSNFTLDCVTLSVYDFSTILRLIALRSVFTILARLNYLLLNDQQPLNVDFDYDSLPDVLVILMSMLVLFHQYNTENSHHKEFYRLQ